MKKNDIVDLRTKTEDELKRMLSDFREEIGKFKIDGTMGKVKNTNALKNKRKDVARVLTFLAMKASLAKEAIEGGKK